MKRFKRQRISDGIFQVGISLSVGLFILLPFLYVFKTGLTIDHHFSLERVITLVTTRPKLLTNTLQLGIVSTLLQTVVALVVAIRLYLSSKRWQKFILFILFVTMISPPFVTSLAYIQLFGRRGLVTYELFHLSLNVYGMWGIAFMQTLAHLSLNVLLVYGVLTTLNPEMIHSARSLGANTSAIIKDILFPQAWVGGKAVVALAFFRSVADFGTPAIIGGKFNVLASASYFAVIADGDLALAATMNLLLLVPAIFVVLLYRRTTASLGGGLNRVADIPHWHKQGAWYWGLTIVSGIGIGALVLLYASIVLSAFTTMQRGNLVFTLENLRATAPYMTTTLWRSIGYSLLAALIGSGLGLLISYYVSIRQVKMMKWVDAIANLPYIVPGTFFGLGYLLAFNHAPLLLTGTAAIVVINVTFKQLPFSVRAGGTAMESLDKQMVDAVHSLGGGHGAALWDVILPLSKQALAVSFINAFTATMTTMGSIIFLVYPNRKVLTLVMFDAIQSGKYAVGSVLALVILIVCLLVNGGFYWWLGGRHVFNS